MELTDAEPDDDEDGPGQMSDIQPSETPAQATGASPDGVPAQTDDYWKLAADPTVSHKDLAAHVNRTQINEDCFDVAGIAAADPDRSGLGRPPAVSTAADGAGPEAAPDANLADATPPDLFEAAANDAFARLAGEDDESYEERVRELRM